jgi:1-acyl-sn-glycerol-3-phosphate acyltransferase/ubiquinone/menaquinone biosynthesis C-methylase UbiE
MAEVLKLSPGYSIVPRILQTLSWLPTRLLLKVFCRFEVRGKENLKGLPQAIFAVNHASELDPIILTAALSPFGRFAPLYFVTAPTADFDHERFKWRRFLYRSNWFFKAWGAYPTNSGHNDYSVSLANHVALLKQCMSLCIFPEGGKTRDGLLRKPHGGVSYLGAVSQVPIIPVAIRGTFHFSLAKLFFSRRSITIEFGRPVVLEQSAATNAEYYKITAERILQNIQKLFDEAEEKEMGEPFWNNYFKDYDVLNELHAYQSLLDDVVRSTGIKAHDVVLDLGAGTGNLQTLLKKEDVSRMVCFDLSKEGLAHCQRKTPWVETVLGDLSDTLPFSDGSFSAVVSSNALYTLSRAKRSKVFDEIYRVLKPGGRVVIANILEHFSPYAIYAHELRTSLAKQGTVKTIKRMVKFAHPTVRMFSHNKKIRKSHVHGPYDFFVPGEQASELKKAGFVVTIEGSRVYANQAELVVGERV